MDRAVGEARKQKHRPVVILITNVDDNRCRIGKRRHSTVARVHSESVLRHCLAVQRTRCRQSATPSIDHERLRVTDVVAAARLQDGVSHLSK